ncbi:hypothetical protein [Leifsonia sp. Leaf264]|uniref:hypothetical protein n=1 Tax=Leifsonia sp. Leaf264 TaxID=1736314 RepID=UPI0006F3D208|nr:hypothetical protein [Leifsonia sp. Leaf264]KQO98475.1 hypothetical protein ASF30_10460 [Leifsonia sp. Leaf264]
MNPYDDELTFDEYRRILTDPNSRKRHGIDLTDPSGVELSDTGINRILKDEYQVSEKYLQYRTEPREKGRHAAKRDPYTMTSRSMAATLGILLVFVGGGVTAVNASTENGIINQVADVANDWAVQRDGVAVNASAGDDSPASGGVEELADDESSSSEDTESGSASGSSGSEEQSTDSDGKSGSDSKSKTKSGATKPGGTKSGSSSSSSSKATDSTKSGSGSSSGGSATGSTSDGGTSHDSAEPSGSASPAPTAQTPVSARPPVTAAAPAAPTPPPAPVCPTGSLTGSVNKSFAWALGANYMFGLSGSLTNNTSSTVTFRSSNKPTVNVSASGPVHGGLSPMWSSWDSKITLAPGQSMMWHTDTWRVSAKRPQVTASVDLGGIGATWVGSVDGRCASPSVGSGGQSSWSA